MPERMPFSEREIEGICKALCGYPDNKDKLTFNRIIMAAWLLCGKDYKGAKWQLERAIQEMSK